MRAVLLLSLLAIIATPPAGAADRPAAPPVFEKDILPVLKAHCGRCHNPKARKGQLNLLSLAGIRRGSETGGIVTPGKPAESLLVEVLAEGLMPPDGKNPPSKAAVRKITAWIAGGARTKAGAFDAGRVLSQHDVLPILHLRCVVCHGARKQEAGLDLRTRAGLLKGGKHGPAIVPGKPDDSLLVKRIAAIEMPPGKLLIDFGIRPVTADELETIRRWITRGAPEIDVPADVATSEPDPLVSDLDRKFWSFAPPRRPAVPRFEDDARVRNAIDSFLLEKLHAAGIDYAPEADRLTLIRRVAIDLTGLPPAWKDVEAFLADKRPDAYETMLENYLASRHYGERWGRYWLDLAGYADSEGKRSADPVRPHAWRFRDYVVRAFNADKPYDRFLLEQIAGDELTDYESAKVITQELMDNLIATGFLRMAPDGTGSDIVNSVPERFEVVIDEIDVLGSAVLGLTLKCAQCHSHKYDPIPQRDYYRMVAVFQGAYDVYDWLKPSFVPGQTKSKAVGRVLNHVTGEETTRWKQARERIKQQVAAVEKKLADRQAELIREYSETRLAKLPEVIREDLRKTLATPPKKRDAVQKYLAGKFEKRLVTNAAALKKQHADFAKLAKTTAAEAKALKGRIPPEPRVRALWDRGQPSPTWLFRRGQYDQPGRPIGPGVPSVLTDGRTPFDARPPWPGSTKTGRRLALARWLVDPDHPLTARVLVNRVWFHHFGRGIVETLSNFGKTGSRPTHPRLLDWLAREFVSHDWSLKQLHRLLMTSSAYRQVSRVAPDSEATDPENRLLWRMPLKRMEAEVIRDSILAVSGRLDPTPFGQPDPVSVRADGLVTSIPGPNGWRRSIYVQQRRKHMPTILETFDLPQMIPNCVERPDSTVASQALHLFNDSMIRQLSQSFAERVIDEVGAEPYQQVERTYQLALSRRPSDEERELGLATLAALTARWRETEDGDKTPPETRALFTYCHTILNSAAFLFVD